MKTWSVQFTNLTKEQAEEMATWFCEQGEQDMDVWFECRDDIKSFGYESKKVVEAEHKIIVECKEW